MSVYFCSECGNLYDITNIPPEASESVDMPSDKKRGKNIYFICKTCGHHELMQPHTLLVSKKSKEIAKEFYTSHTKPSDMMSVNVLMHTRDYICPNKECSTHKHPETRNAMMNRVGNTFKMQYICTLCQTTWS